MNALNIYQIVQHFKEIRKKDHKKNGFTPYNIIETEKGDLIIYLQGNKIKNKQNIIDCIDKNTHY